MPSRGYVEITNQLVQRQIHRSLAVGAPRVLSGSAFSSVLDELRTRGVRIVRLGGGEPLTHPDIASIARQARSAGFVLEIETSGRGSSNRAKAATLAGAYADTIAFLVVGADAPTHDEWVAVGGAFAETMGAIGSLLALANGPSVEILIPVFSANLPSVAPLLERFAADERVRFRVRACKTAELPPDAGFDAVDTRSLGEVLERLLARHRGLARRVAVEGVVYCFWRAHGLYPVVDTGQHVPTCVYRLADEEVTDERPAGEKPPEHCLCCSFFEVCPGIAPDDRSQLDASFAHPRALVPSFMRVLAVASPEHDTRVRGEADRFASIEVAGRVTHHKLVSAFYTPESFRRAKDRGLFFFNVSDQFPVTNFASQLRQLVPSAPGAWTLASAPPFVGEGPFDSELVESLDGRVLDVGFGAFLYGARVAALVKAAKIRYLGIDPDVDAHAAATARFPELDLRMTALEDLSVEPESFDWALLLGCVNHFRDLPRALGIVHRALRAGGRVLASDNVSFALAGNVPARGELSGRWEHHRNLDLPQASAVLAMHGFEVLREKPVVPGRNQWFLVARKT